MSRVLWGKIPSGYGSGDGYGSGSGYGDGDGDGYGYGSGSGDGYGSGSGDGYGYGYGDGSGSGSGSGSGDGYGYGYGDGSGSGSGSGSGYGYGSGYGDGYGSGYGDGSGYGSGDGYGYGDGSGSMKSYLRIFVSGLPRDRKIRAKQLMKSGATLAYWRSDKEGRPANGGSAEPVYPGLIQKVSGPLNLCSRGTLHATYTPSKWKGERVWLVAMIGKIVEQDDKLGALEREIIAELAPEKQ